MLVEARDSRGRGLDRAKVGVMVVVTVVVYPLDERGIERDVGGLGGGRRVHGLLVPGSTILSPNPSSPFDN